MSFLLLQESEGCYFESNSSANFFGASLRHALMRSSRSSCRWTVGRRTRTHGWICVGVGDVIGDRIGLHQFLTLIKVRFNHQGVFFLINARQELFLDFEGAGAV